MATLTDFYIKRNDTRPEISVTALDDAGAAVNLTGATVKFFMKQNNTLKVNGTGSLISAAAGTMKYQWVAADTDTAGDYLAEFQVTFGDGRILTFPNATYINVHVITDLSS